MEQDTDTASIKPPRAVVLKNYGGIQNIQVWFYIQAMDIISFTYVQQVEPLQSPLTPEENQVVVSVRACGLNFADIYTRQGLIREKKPPFILGLECAGVVEELGKQVTHLKVWHHLVHYIILLNTPLL